jgi:hypothetical protein
MVNRLGRNLAAVLCLFYVSVTMTVGATEPARERTWSFQGQAGTIKIRASEWARDTDPKSYIAIDLWVESGQSGIEEEGRFLSFALTELPKFGFDTSSISIMLFRLDQTNADKQIAPYAAMSRKWNSVARARSATITYPVVTAMLNESGVFQNWFATFRTFGLQGRVVGIEKLGTMAFKATGASCPVAVDCNRVLVPATALVQVNFEPVR